MKKTILIVIFGVLIIAALSLVPKKNNDKKNDHPLEASVVDFISCTNAGFPITETFPAQCRTSSGQVFIEEISDYGDVLIEFPAFGDLITSPVQIKGKARGFWFFEGTMPVVLKDENGKVLAQTTLEALDDWMTDSYVNFSGEINFSSPETQYGVIIVQKDNPSGLEEFDASFAVPVRFK